MGFCGGIISQAPGSTQDMILEIIGRSTAYNCATIDARVMPEYWTHSYGIFINGIWTGKIIKPSIFGRIHESITFQHGTQLGSIWIEDFGWETNDHFIPSGAVEEHENSTANRLAFDWQSSMTVSGTYSDNSLSNIQLTGISRFSNCEPLSSCRAKLWYTITNISGSYYIRLFHRNHLVAEGNGIGSSGPITLTERNKSGVSGTIDLSYTADIPPNTAWIEFTWPASYQVHYSKYALSFPRTPEIIITDVGGSNFHYLTPILEAGSYNWNILAVSDQGIVQSIIPATIPLIIQLYPTAPINITARGTANATIVSWLAGEDGCTYDVYYSNINEPPNMGIHTLPVPIHHDGTGLLQVQLNPITGYAGIDRNTAYWTLEAAVGAAIDTANIAFIAGPTGFDAALITLKASIESALDAFAVAYGGIDIEFTKLRLERPWSALVTINSNKAALSATLWSSFVKRPYQYYIACLSTMIDGVITHFTLSDGSYLNYSEDTNTPLWNWTFKQLCTPTIIPGRVRVIVRATKNALQESKDSTLIVEYDQSGNVVLPRPGISKISSLTISNREITIEAMVNDITAGAASKYLDIYLLTGSSGLIDWDYPDATVLLTDSIAGIRRGVVTIIAPADGYYRLGISARTNAGIRELTPSTQVIKIETTIPPTVSPTAKVIRGSS